MTTQGASIGGVELKVNYSLHGCPIVVGHYPENHTMVKLLATQTMKMSLAMRCSNTVHRLGARSEMQIPKKAIKKIEEKKFFSLRLCCRISASFLEDSNDTVKTANFWENSVTTNQSVMVRGSGSSLIRYNTN